MDNDKPTKARRIRNGRIGPLGETVTLEVETEGGNVDLEFDAQYLEDALPVLIGLASKAREIADAGVSPVQNPGDIIRAKLMQITAFVVLAPARGDHLGVEFRLSPTGLPMRIALARQTADRLCKELLQALRGKRSRIFLQMS